MNTTLAIDKQKMPIIDFEEKIELDCCKTELLTFDVYVSMMYFYSLFSNFYCKTNLQMGHG